MLSCKGICTSQLGARRASAGRAPDPLPDGTPWVLCSVCQVRFPHEGRHCPCCGAYVRRRTRAATAAGNRRYKARLRREREAEP